MPTDLCLDSTTGAETDSLLIQNILEGEEESGSQDTLGDLGGNTYSCG